MYSGHIVRWEYKTPNQLETSHVVEQTL